MRSKLKQTLLPILTALIWGTAFVAQDVCADHITAMTFNTLRFFIAVVFLIIVKAVIHLVKGRAKRALPAPDRPPRPEYARRLFIAALCCGTALAVASILQQAGMDRGTDSGKSGFITALYVVLVPIGGLFLKKRVRPIFWLALFLAVTGLYLLCINGSFRLAPGDLLTLLCAVAFTVQILLIDRFAPGLDSIDFCCAEFIVAGIWSLIGMFLFESPSLAAIGECILPLLYVAIFSSGIAYLLQIVAQREGDPALVTILFSLEAVFSAIASAIILRQRMSLREYSGCALMFAAVIIAQLPAREKKE
jgi:drug/metabolite transporter (DMT)-like permease